MTPAARISAVIDILGLIEALDRPADRVVEHWHRGHRFAGSKDRAAINNLLYGVLRHRAMLVWAIQQHADERAVGPRSMVLAELAHDESLDKAGVSVLFDSSRYGPATLNDDEEFLLTELLAAMHAYTGIPSWVGANCPEWLYQEISNSLGDSAAAEMLAMQHRPPLDLRTNRIKATPEEVIRALAAEGVTAERCPHASGALRVFERASVRGTAAYRDGLIEVQDEGSQMASALVDARPGQTIIDLCAGAGGKSLALAASMTNKGVIHACDVNASRLRRMGPRLRRAGASIVQAHKISGDDDPWFDGCVGTADRVLIDAPCTGIGTTRRNPDLPWRLTRNDIDRNVSLQRNLLDRGATLVAPGGRLIYVTCSLLEQENGERVLEFLSAQPAFGAVPVGQIWPGVLDSPAPHDGDGVLLTPDRYGTDGFFVAVLERRE